MNLNTLLTAFTQKALLIITCITVIFSSLTVCNAQSVVGKWNQTFDKILTMDKATGKFIPVSAQVQQQMESAIIASGYKATLEIKSDGTYVSTVFAGGDSKPQIRNAKYSLSGKNLEMNIPLVQNEKTTITILSLTNTTMIWDLLYKGRHSEVTYTRM